MCPNKPRHFFFFLADHVGYDGCWLKECCLPGRECAVTAQLAQPVASQNSRRQRLAACKASHRLLGIVNAGMHALGMTCMAGRIL